MTEHTMWRFVVLACVFIICCTAYGVTALAANTCG